MRHTLKTGLLATALCLGLTSASHAQINFSLGNGSGAPTVSVGQPYGYQGYAQPYGGYAQPAAPYRQPTYAPSPYYGRNGYYANGYTQPYNYSSGYAGTPARNGYYAPTPGYGYAHPGYGYGNAARPGSYGTVPGVRSYRVR